MPKTKPGEYELVIRKFKDATIANFTSVGSKKYPSTTTLVVYDANAVERGEDSVVVRTGGTLSAIDDAHPIPSDHMPVWRRKA